MKKKLNYLNDHFVWLLIFDNLYLIIQNQKVETLGKKLFEANFMVTILFFNLLYAMYMHILMLLKYFNYFYVQIFLKI